MTKEQLSEYGAIMDNFLTASDVKFYVHIPRGTQEAEIESNLDLSMCTLVSFYAAIHVVAGCARNLANDLPKTYNVEKFADDVAAMVASAIREGLTAEAKNDR